MRKEQATFLCSTYATTKPTFTTHISHFRTHNYIFRAKRQTKKLVLNIKKPKFAIETCTWQANCLPASMYLAFRQGR